MAQQSTSAIDAAAGHKALPWESLVTDGHIRAARWRRAGPVILIMGLVLLGVGLWLGSPRVTTELRDRNSLLDARISAIQAPAEQAVDQLPALVVPRKDAKELVPEAQLGQVIKVLKDSLNKTGRLSDQLKFKRLAATAFWRNVWPIDQLVTTGDGDVRLVGAVVNIGSTRAPIVGRWIGAFRKAGGTWRYTTIEAASLIDVQGEPGVPISQIALFLKPVLPTKE